MGKLVMLLSSLPLTETKPPFCTETKPSLNIHPSLAAAA
jgi:hypothetical protein